MLPPVLPLVLPPVLPPVLRPVLRHRHESQGLLRASVGQVFSYLDDHVRLSSHMRKSSWMMGGGRMHIDVDGAQGKALGSHIRLHGRVFGIAVSVDEIVTERNPPCRKIWETTGTPRLLVIGHYRMGFELAPQQHESMQHESMQHESMQHESMPRESMQQESLLRVFIEYALPDSTPARWLGRVFAPYYARWCTQQMVDDAVKYFTASQSR